MSDLKIDSGHAWFAKEDFNKAIADLEASRARVKEFEKKLAACENPIRRYAALEEALTPSPETKSAYIGEFSFGITERDEDGDEHIRQVVVPWTTTKDIMAKIKEYAKARY
jgi:hypothetical protein